MTELLATMAELAELRGVRFDPTDVKALRALEDASGIFRSLARQSISKVEDDVVELAGTWSRRLWLPERPVLDVTALAITDSQGYSTTYALSGVRWSRRGLLRIVGCHFGGPDATVHLTYSHGYEEVPDDVRSTVLKMAARQIANPEDVQSEAIGSYSVTYDPAVTGAAAGLSSQELRVIKKYRPVAA